jgi:4-amino-4-deoxy-L-arabinose transferase-like glycosyltransferase
LTAALLLFRLGQVPLAGPDEPRYARVAVEMQRAGEWVTPTLQGEPWLEKPPLYYWLAGLACRLLGETELAARLPSLLACLLLVGVTALAGARLYGVSAGLHAGFVTGTGGLVFVYGHAASMDMLLAAMLTTASALLALGLLGFAGRLAIPAAYVFMGLAVLAKGPIGVLLPGLIVLVYLGVTGEWRLLRRLVSPGALLLFLLVAVPWHVAIYLDQGQRFVDVFLLDHNLQRFTSTIHRHPGPAYYYLPLIVGGLYPWSGLLLPGLAGLAPRRSRADLFVLLWFAVPFVFFSAAGSKLAGYILPCLPPLALLMGRAAGRLVDEPGPGTSLGARAAALLGVLLGSVLLAIPIVLLRRSDPLWQIALPPAAWGLLVALLFSWRVARDPGGALRLLRIGAAGLLLLVAQVAPEYVAARESGRDLFRQAGGREVLAWGAWRTAWMSGYFYNDGRVREVASVENVLAAAGGGSALVLCGPGQRRQLESMSAIDTRVLAVGPRRNALLRVRARNVPTGTEPPSGSRPAPRTGARAGDRP